eukprot:scaffold26170_cov90-Isochrysis_galbana.AAC.2
MPYSSASTRPSSRSTTARSAGSGEARQQSNRSANRPASIATSAATSACDVSGASISAWNVVSSSDVNPLREPSRSSTQEERATPADDPSVTCSARWARPSHASGSRIEPQPIVTDSSILCDVGIGPRSASKLSEGAAQARMARAPSGSRRSA